MPPVGGGPRGPIPGGPMPGGPMGGMYTAKLDDEVIYGLGAAGSIDRRDPLCVDDVFNITTDFDPDLGRSVTKANLIRKGTEQIPFETAGDRLKNYAVIRDLKVKLAHEKYEIRNAIKYLRRARVEEMILEEIEKKSQVFGNRVKVKSDLTVEDVLEKLNEEDYLKKYEPEVPGLFSDLKKSLAQWQERLYIKKYLKTSVHKYNRKNARNERIQYAKRRRKFYEGILGGHLFHNYNIYSINLGLIKKEDDFEGLLPDEQDLAIIQQAKSLRTTPIANQNPVVDENDVVEDIVQNDDILQNNNTLEPTNTQDLEDVEVLEENQTPSMAEFPPAVKVEPTTLTVPTHFNITPSTVMNDIETEKVHENNTNSDIVDITYHYKGNQLDYQKEYLYDNDEAKKIEAEREQKQSAYAMTQEQIEESRKKLDIELDRMLQEASQSDYVASEEESKTIRH